VNFFEKREGGEQFLATLSSPREERNFGKIKRMAVFPIPVVARRKGCLFPENGDLNPARAQQLCLQSTKEKRGRHESASHHTLRKGGEAKFT